MASEVNIVSTKNKSRCKYCNRRNNLKKNIQSFPLIGQMNRHPNDKTVHKRQSKFILPDLELVTVFEQEGDLISTTQEISSIKV